ncbi:uncharacterized protein B0H18DRAFT_1116048 [Fomitopsis serialis]|uniref:uncharacterized protein n=1 Tax=Fomitopsis serialis TaxID=139415 RepID=UPI002008093B|nr:uncharacterized protein B0H18DRAFT_1123912 [Neoantrodia serialis]XP_047897268.1 uncharacterized protein B0H18DRAFT_1116048 [Neoantrodia serialis]KAH9916926.1 hypothetical protein B0H18DRAFT_1123912 [Neoantrodia serialis]KAH9932400.1 hypothetical protein B0H18DRAFT_1116048 [Neoantrodia serialis]
MERYSDIVPGVNDSADALLVALNALNSEVSPSTLFAVAFIITGEPFANGAPQNTFVPGVIELAERRKAFIGGGDLQPLPIASYNHLGNSYVHKRSVIMVDANHLFKHPKPGAVSGTKAA